MTRNQLHKGDVHRLSPDDLALVEREAIIRYERSRQDGVEDVRIVPGSPYENDRTGIAGEVAFARMIGAEPDIRHDYSPYDIILPDGRTVDVKASKSRYKGATIAGSKEIGQFDIVALIWWWPFSGLAHFMGWCTAEEGMRPEYLRPDQKREGQPVPWIVPVHALHSPLVYGPVSAHEQVLASTLFG